MQNWKRIVLWVVVAALVLSVAVCQKKTQQEKPAAAPPEEEISSVPEEAAEPAEEPESEEKPAEAEAPKEEEPAAAEEKPEMAAKEEPEKPAEAAAAKEITRDNAAAIIELAKGGRIVMEFYPQDAPNTVDNFITLAKKGFYDGVTFHRVEPGFVVQGGDPEGTGFGGPGYTIKAEFNSRKHLLGTVAMARRSDHPDTAGSQFYICLNRLPSLDGNYTVFGQVIEGMDLVKGIAKGDVMKKVTIIDKATVQK